MKAANNNTPRMAFRGAWVGGEFFPDSSQERLDKVEVEQKKKFEGKAISKLLKRISVRQSIGDGWDGKAANDNTTPAIKWLLAGQRKEMLEPLLAYIRLDREANSGAMLTGESHSARDMLQIDQKTWLDPVSGAIKYKGERRLTGIDFTGREAPVKSSLDPMQVKPLPVAVPKPWKGDLPVINRIDAEPKLARIRAALGPLLIPFERLVLEGKKLEKVGWDCFATNERAAMSIGGAVLMLSLGVVAEHLEAAKRKRAA
jgi:hypothetical protein